VPHRIIRTRRSLPRPLDSLYQM